jgi:glycosyltransferase involved in cell wall biosynthesis
VKIKYYSKYSSLGPSSRFRVYQYADLFRSAGVDFQISELFDDEYFRILRSNAPFRALRKIPYTLSRFTNRKQDLDVNVSDLTIIEHQLFPYLPFAIEKKYLPARFLFEFDDAIYLTHPAKIPRLIQASQGVIAGNEILAEFARKYHKNVHLIPTALNTDFFRPAARKAQDKVVIGWSGLEYNFPYLEILSPVLKRLIETQAVEVRILSGAPPVLDFPFQFERWDPSREVEQLNQFDIGVMPLKMDEWSKGKCGFKLLQYMSLEIPSVATAVGVNEKIVQDGVNGYLAGNLKDWENHLTELIVDANLRQTIGKAARLTVLKEYSTAVWFPKLLNLYRTYAQS